MRTLTRWVAVLALCPGCHLDASASIPVVCEHCITSHLCTTHLSGVTPRNDKHWCRRAALARRARGRYCASLGDNVPLSTALPLINKQMWGHMPLDRRANVPCDNTRPQPVNQVAMSCGALHPLRGATPVMWRYTRYVVLHPLRGATPDQIGCNAHGSGVPGSQTGLIGEPGIPQCERRRPQRTYTEPGTWQANQVVTSRGALHPLCGATPVVWCYTRSERVHCSRIGCNAHGLGAMPTDRVQCPRIGCTGLADRNDRGTWNPAIRKKRPQHPHTNPGTWHANQAATTRGALHPLCGATPDQNGCNAHGSGAMPTDRV